MIRKSLYIKKDGLTAVYERPSRVNHIYFPNGPHNCTWVKIPQDSIYFKEKEYPNCKTCPRKYLPELGCLWCVKIVSHGRKHSE